MTVISTISSLDVLSVDTALETQDASHKENFTPPFSQADTVNISQAAYGQAGTLEKSGPAKATVTLLDKEIASSMMTGPDLIDGWDEAGYLTVSESGYTGSVSFTTKYGSKVSVTAGTNEDGSPSEDLYITVQRQNGDIYLTKLGTSLRITETEEGVEFHVTSDGTEGDDIIISRNFAMTGGAGDDTLIFVGRPTSESSTAASLPTNHQTMDGGEGDDTLVSLGTMDEGTWVSTGRGNDRAYMRAYEGVHQGGVSLGEGNNTVVIDTVADNSRMSLLSVNAENLISIRNAVGTIQGQSNNSSNQFTIDSLSGYFTLNGASQNTFSIAKLSGYLSLFGASQNTFSIVELSGSLHALETPEAGRTGTSSGGMSNAFFIKQMTGGSLWSIAGHTSLDMEMVDNGSVRVQGGSDNRVSIGSVGEYGRVSVWNGTFSVESSLGVLFIANGDLTAKKTSGSVWGGHSTVTISSHNGMLFMSNSTVDIEEMTGAISFGGDMKARFGTLSNGRFFGFKADTTSLEMTVGFMNNMNMLINSGLFDVHVDRMENSAVAIGLDAGKDKPSGVVTVERASDCVFYGEGYDIKGGDNYLLTSNKSVWYATKIYGARDALAFVNRFGEAAFGEGGMLLPEYLSKY